MGDLVQSLYVLEDLKRASGHEVSLLLDKRLERFAGARAPWLDAAYTVDVEKYLRGFRNGRPWQGLWNALASELEPLRPVRFDRVLNLNYGRLAACVADAVRGGAPVEGFHSTGEGTIGGPWVDLISRLVRRNRKWNRFHLVDVFRFHAERRVPPDGIQSRPWRALDDRSVLAVQVATRGRKRTWRPERFVEVVRGLQEDVGCEVLLLGEARERPVAESIAGKAGGGRVRSLAGKTSLEDLVDILRLCDRLLSGDTGTLHLACRLGVPSLALFFGPASAFETGPYGTGHVVVQAEPPCAPCGEDAPCPERACGDGIAPETVLRLLEGERVEPCEGVSVYRSAFVGDWMRYRPLHRKRARPDDVLGYLYWGAAGEFLGTEQGRLPSVEQALQCLVEDYRLEPDRLESAGFSVDSALPAGLGKRESERLQGILRRAWRQLKGRIHEYAVEESYPLAAPAA